MNWWRRPPWWVSPIRSRGRDLCLRHLNTGVDAKSDELKKELVQQVRKEIGPIATDRCAPMGRRPAQNPQRQDHAAHPEKDRRRQVDELGDTSTIADPSAIETLVKERIGLPG
jgi:acetyl-CoA synthetase